MFTKSKDGGAYILFVSNDSNGRQTPYRFSKDDTDNFQMQHGSQIEDHIFELIKEDMSKGLI